MICKIHLNTVTNAEFLLPSIHSKYGYKMAALVVCRCVPGCCCVLSCVVAVCSSGKRVLSRAISSLSQDWSLANKARTCGCDFLVRVRVSARVRDTFL